MIHRSTRDKISLPTQTVVERELLFFLNGIRPIEPVKVYGPLADKFNLNSLQRHAQMQDGRCAWENRVQFARRRLVDLGFLDNSRRGLWFLTSTGKEEAERRQNEPRPMTLEELDLLIENLGK
jgi:restriction endonuclease Mrr